jgi:hypothetical protein
LVGTATLEDNLETQFVFEITNRGPAALHNIRPVVRETYATSPCIALYESCSSATLQLQRPVSQFFDWFALESLAPGRSAQVTLRFPRAFASLSGYSGNPELHLVLRYDGAAADLPFILNAAPLPNVPTNLVVTVPRLEVSQGVARLALRIFNFGPAPSGDFTLAVSVTATRSASDPTPVSVAMQAFDYEVRTRTDVVVGSGRCMPSAPSFTCTLPSVEAPSLDPRLADRPVYIVGTTTFVAPSAGYVSVTATVRSRLADADDRDNTETVDTTLVPPPPTFDLAAGGFIGGEMIIQNAGPAAAFDVLVQVALPSNWRLSPASASSHCSGSRAWGATVMCQIPLVPVGGVGEPIDIEIAPGGGSQGQMWILQSSGGTDINHLNDTVVF